MLAAASRRPQIEMQREKFLPFAQPDLDGSELEEIRESLLSGWVTTGPKTKQFEREFAKVVGARHAIAVNSCTGAMHLALEAIGLKEGDQVITTPYTFAATAEVIHYLGARPVFVDVEPQTLNLDIRAIERAITKRTKAILPVHIGGLPADISTISAIAQNHHLRVIEDAAHAFPAKCHGAMIGALSDFTCFSFYATKTITTGEGGMICTDSDAWAERCRCMSIHGLSKDAWNRYTCEGSWYYEIHAPGFKYNMTDIAAAMGVAQLRRAQSMLARRVDIARRYNNAFELMPELQRATDQPDCQHAWHLYMLRLNLNRLKLNRAQFVEELKKRNIGASVHFIPLHVHPYYRETYGYKAEDFPVAYREYMREVSLPIYSKMSDQDVEDVIGAVTDIVDKWRV
jgi:dTDP-4-amino-4,6-dideoxygalactose transaminase